MRRPTNQRVSVTVTPGFWALLCLLIAFGGRAAVLFFAAAVLHELGHILVLRVLRIPICGLSLGGSGAALRADLTGAAREAWAIFAGPGTNLLLLFCCRRLFPGFALCNLALAVYNLLPVLPLDGGRLCAMLLPRLFGAAGEVLCRSLAWLVVLAAVLGGVYGTCFLHLGLLPILASAAFLLRLGACQTERKML